MFNRKIKILIVGHARHGKDTLAELIGKYSGLTYKSSSIAASELFLYDIMKGKYGYITQKECFEDRFNHRKEWHDLILDYNKNDKTRLAKNILKQADIYVGARDINEIKECIRQGIFDCVIGVYDYRKGLESYDSFNISMSEVCDFIIQNNGSLYDLEKKVAALFGIKVEHEDKNAPKLYECNTCRFSGITRNKPNPCRVCSEDYNCYTPSNKYLSDFNCEHIEEFARRMELLQMEMKETEYLRQKRIAIIKKAHIAFAKYSDRFKKQTCAEIGFDECLKYRNCKVCPVNG